MLPRTLGGKTGTGSNFRDLSETSCLSPAFPLARTRRVVLTLAAALALGCAAARISKGDADFGARHSGAPTMYAVAKVSQGDAAAGPQAHTVLVAPKDGAYIAAFPDLGGGEDIVETARIEAFEKAVAKPIAWTYFSNNWNDRIAFPKAAVETIYAAGSVPFIRLMARSSGGSSHAADPLYSMQAIISGKYDADLEAWARDARDVGRPLLAEFGTEVNGDWFPWNGRWNGGGATDGYGDSKVADGPERFRDAFRHIIDICRAQGATNITWFLHVDASRAPDEPWNRMAAYYPGDDYIDWIGISVYGSQHPGGDWISFVKKLDAAYPELAAISATKPLAILEYGVVEDPAHDKAQWIRDALGAIRAGRWPRIKAASYWDEAWGATGARIDLRVSSSPAALAAYREEIAGAFFKTKLEFARAGRGRGEE